jgi:hypothetical protein
VVPADLGQAAALAAATGQVRRWQRTAGLLARLPATVTAGMFPPRLLDDLRLVADGGPRPGSYSLRVVALWAPGAMDSRLIEALVATRLPGLGPPPGPTPEGPGPAEPARASGAAGQHGTLQHVAWHLPLRIDPGSPDDAKYAVPRLLIGADAAAAWDRIAGQLGGWLRSGPPLPPHLAMLPAMAGLEPAGPQRPADMAGNRGFLTECHGYRQADAVLRRLSALRELCALAGLRPADQDDCPPALLRVRAGEHAACWTAAPLALRVLPCADPYGQSASGRLAAEAIRAELAAAHAVLGIVGYEDVAVPGSPRPHLTDLGVWLRLAGAQVGPARVTLAVDGVGRSRSGRANTGDWVRQRARTELQLSASLPPESIIPVNADLAIEAASGGNPPHPPWAARYWEASGLPLLLDRAVHPLTVDPATEFALAAIREFSMACAAVSERCRQILTLDPANGGELGVSVTSALQRRARLAATAARPLAARAAAALAR